MNGRLGATLLVVTNPPTKVYTISFTDYYFLFPTESNRRLALRR